MPEAHRELARSLVRCYDIFCLEVWHEEDGSPGKVSSRPGTHWQFALLAGERSERYATHVDVNRLDASLGWTGFSDGSGGLKRSRRISPSEKLLRGSIDYFDMNRTYVR